MNDYKRFYDIGVVDGVVMTLVIETVVAVLILLGIAIGARL